MHRHKYSTRSPSKSMLELVSYTGGDRQLSAVAPPYSHRFKLPCGWGVEEVPRSNGSRSDTYYYEAGTGRKFRSTKEVERYLRGEEDYPSSRCRSTRNSYQDSGYQRMLLSCETNLESRRMIVSGGKLLTLDNEPSHCHLAIVPSRKAPPAAPCILPEGWVVEEVPRRYSTTWKDRYYYEPETGQKFRSLVAVARYLEENAPLSKALEEIKENKPLSKVFKTKNHFKKYTRRKITICEENEQDSSYSIDVPPMKVNWVLGSPKGDAWNPFISEALVHESVKNEWTNRFIMFMNDEMCT
ncbi:hypothetical protein ACJIZ3_012584 [Penstemon smallii]|uniref:MBD domain-containing protein n=1 Tax=Penstemon smallii TaxID=265156 RepID=A0ABD3UR26_9LAMI